MMKDDLVAAAVHLFGEKGYASTSVADIQVACGLTPGSGALYKHFASKGDLLAEAVQRYVSDLEKSRVRLIEVLPDDPRSALTAIAEAVSSAMGADRSIIRVSLRDLEGFPDLLALLWDGLLANLYREIADWIEALKTRRAVAVADSQATAAVLVASLTYYRILEALIGHTPGDVGLEAFLTAWVESAVSTLEVATGAS